MCQITDHNAKYQIDFSHNHSVIIYAGNFAGNILVKIVAALGEMPLLTSLDALHLQSCWSSDKVAVLHLSDLFRLPSISLLYNLSH